MLRFIIAVLACAAFATGQEYRSTVSGRVLDPTGSAIPGAAVSATKIDTNNRFETVTGADGFFTLTLLPPGEYQIKAASKGFKTYVQSGFTVGTNQRIEQNVELQIGDSAQSVTISADAPLLEASTASTGQVINSRQMEFMPVNGRTPMVLAQLASGVTPTGSPRFVRPFDNGGSSDFAMGGAPKVNNELLLDGAPDIGSGGNVAYSPPVDAVMELKVESFQSDAAYGHAGGGTVNVVLKSGTNAVHGAAYEFNQVSALAATPYFLNRSGQKKNVTRYNQWGVTGGGPVWIPKLLDGRNRLFFYFAYEGLRDGLPRPSTQTVPTAAERTGDLSELLKAGAQYQLYDPYSGVREGSRVRRQPLAGNIIPSTRISPVAKNVLGFYPMPNNPAGLDGQNNFVTNQVENNIFSNWLGRMDFNASDRHKIYMNIRTNLRTTTNNAWGNIANGAESHRLNWGGMLDDVLTLSPTTVLNTRVSFSRYNDDKFLDSTGYDLTQLGFPKYVAAASTAARLPAFTFDRFASIADDSNSNRMFDVYQIFSTVTKIVGKHSLKAGADLRMYRQIDYTYGSSAGTYSFSSNWNRGPLDNASAAPLGQDFAAFMYGLPTGGGFDLNANRANQAGYVSLFLQDDVRVRHDLTLNLGLRYERDLPTRERYNRSVNGFDFTSPSPISAAATAAYAKSPIPEMAASQFKVPGGLLFAGAQNRNIYDTKSMYFSPRLGFAWKPAVLGGKTVLRGGMGVFVFPIGTAGVVQSGFSQTTSVVPTLDTYLTPNATLSNPFPSGIDQPVGSSQGLATFMGKSVNFFNPDPQNAYSVRWALNLQRELPGKIAAELGYSGNHAVHLPISRQLNFTPGQYYSTKPTRDQAAIDFLSANVNNPFAGLIPGTGLNGATTSRSQLLKPYSQFTGVQMDNANEGNSYFHMMALRVEKRFSGGLQLLANYQYSRMISRMTRLNDFDAFLEKRPAAEDRPHRFVISASYDLPFGRKKALLSSAPRVVNGVIGDWSINAICQRQSGQVLGWGNILYSGGDIKLNARGVDGAFDTTQFNTKSAEQLGSNVRTFPSAFSNLRQDAPNVYDFSAIKAFPIWERVKLQYRCEWFNAFNHAVFNGPNTSPTNSSFGKITGVNNIPRVIQMALRLTW